MNRFNFGKTDKSSSDSHSFGDTWQSQSGKRGNRDRKNHFGKTSAKDGPRNQYREGDRGFSKFGRPQHKKRGPKAIKLNKALQYALKDNPIDMEDTINNTPELDAVVIGTPIDLTKLITINKPTIVVRYELKEREGSILLKDVLGEFLSD